MALAIQLVSWLLWFPLKILGINALLRAGVRRYPLILTYIIVTFLIAAVQIPFSFTFLRKDPAVGAWLQKLNSIGDSVTYTLILAVVLSFIYRATSGVASRRLLRTALIGGAVLLMAVSFAVHYDARATIGVWMSPWTRDVHFGAAILDLVAWGMLLASREKDTRLLLLTGGMGLMFAGEAVGAALRSLSIPYRSFALYYSAHAVKVLSDAAFLYIWWQVFRNDARRRSQEGAPHVMVNGK